MQSMGLGWDTALDCLSIKEPQNSLNLLSWLKQHNFSVVEERSCLCLESCEGALSAAGGLERGCCPFGDAHHFSLLALQQYSQDVGHLIRECAQP